MLLSGLLLILMLSLRNPDSSDCVKLPHMHLFWSGGILEVCMLVPWFTLSHFHAFRSGDVLEVRMLVPENQRKQYSYRGVCIARYNKGIRSSFKLYNVYPDAGPVVQV